MKAELNRLASEIARREGGKSQARIGDIRSILKIIVTIHAEAILNHKPRPTAVLNEYAKKVGAKLAKKRLNKPLLKKKSKK